MFRSLGGARGKNAARRRKASVVCGVPIAVLGSLVVTGCGDATAPSTSAPTTRLIDLFRPDAIQGRVRPAGEGIRRTEWRFDESSSSAESEDHAETVGWRAGSQVAELVIRDGRLTGSSTGDVPLLHVERTDTLATPGKVHAIEVRMRASAGANMGMLLIKEDSVDLEEMVETFKGSPWVLRSPIIADEEFHTYTVTPPVDVQSIAVRQIVLQPTDVADAVFEIESLRVIFRAEHLASIPSGVGWHGLSDIYHEAIAARASERIHLSARLPARAWLDVSLGTIDPGPLMFRVAVTSSDGGDSSGTVVLERTLTTPDQWEPVRIDLGEHAGTQVTLSLSLASETEGAIGFWGSPVVRSDGARPANSSGDAPQGVILIWADTLRRDHLSVYGYERETSPVLEKMASEGVLFRDCIVQATWTKVSTPSLMTGMYPASHGVREFNHRLPASATTLAEVLRDAGYATLSMSSILFTGKFTNLHQGFEQVHESSSLASARSSKTSRDFVNRLLPWLESHRDVPFFVFLHVADPHDPFEPYPPYDTMWADPSAKEAHQRRAKAVKEFIKDPLLKDFGMPNRAELVAAGIDPDEYIAHEIDWYDGSIRGMDAEIGRLFERLRRLGLERKTLVVFTSDHGEEFLDHGRMFHGQSVYGELNQMPLIMWRPGTVPAGLQVKETVENIDLMPTILQMCGLEAPEAVQGRSVLPLLAAGRKSSDWEPYPSFSEKAATVHGAGPPPRDTESFAIVHDGWKLIHNPKRADGSPEYELYRHGDDPLDQKDLANENPRIVDRLIKRLADWHAYTSNAKLRSDGEAQADLSPKQLERLRSLGYID